jgi:hypothetical protein
MLDDEKKRIIDVEERFRHALRLQLEAEAAKLKAEAVAAGTQLKQAEKKLGGKVMEFLNSSVGMWLLSSVVITGGAAALQQIQHHYEIEQKNQSQLATYQFEIGNRIQNMKYFLRHAKTVGEAKSALGSVFKSKFPISAELEHQSLSTLYFNLHQLIKGSEKEKNVRALAVIRDLEDAEILLQSRPDQDPLNAADRESFSKLISAIESLHLTGEYKF